MSHLVAGCVCLLARTTYPAPSVTLCENAVVDTVELFGGGVGLEVLTGRALVVCGTLRGWVTSGCPGSAMGPPVASEP